MKSLNKFLFLIISLALFNVNLKSQEWLELQLFNAIENNNIIEVKGLLELGVDVNAKNSDGETPLMYAISTANENIIQLLIESGADVYAKIYHDSGVGLYTYDSFILNSSERLTKFLIESGYDNPMETYTVLDIHYMDVFGAPDRYEVERRKEAKIARKFLKIISEVEQGHSSFEDQTDVIQKILALRWLNQGKFQKLALVEKGLFYKDIAKVYIKLKSGEMPIEEINAILDGSHDLSICLKSKERLWNNLFVKLIRKHILGITENKIKEKEAYKKLRSKVKQIEPLASKLPIAIAYKIVLKY